MRDEDKEKYLVGRNGDSLIAPFQCDYCWFVNLKKRLPDIGKESDTMLMGYIRRVNLDVFWSRAPGTISGYKSAFNKGKTMCNYLTIEPTYIPPGPWPIGDHSCFTVALQIVRASQLSGTYSESAQEFDTVRNLRTIHSHTHERSAYAALLRSVFRGSKGEVVRLSECATHSLLFERFMQGLLARMGRDTRSNFGLDHRILLKILRSMDQELRDQNSDSDRKRFLIMTAAYFVISFVCSLRGNEGFMLDCGGLRYHINHGNEKAENYPHVIIPLLGKFKGETGEKYHLLMSVPVTESGLNPRLWLQRVVGILAGEDKSSGPAFCNRDGSSMNRKNMEREFHVQLNRVKNSRPDLIPVDTQIEEVYGINRSFRRGSESRAVEQSVRDSDIELVNRWRVVERNKGQRPRSSMKEYYLEVRLLRKRILVYSSKL